MRAIPVSTTRRSKGTIHVMCTGDGNEDEGCLKETDVHHSELRWFDAPTCTNDMAVVFKCPACFALTDLPSHQWPSNFRDLTKYTPGWKYEK